MAIFSLLRGGFVQPLGSAVKSLPPSSFSALRPPMAPEMGKKTIKNKIDREKRKSNFAMSDFG